MCMFETQDLLNRTTGEPTCDVFGDSNRFLHDHSKSASCSGEVIPARTVSSNNMSSATNTPPNNNTSSTTNTSSNTCSFTNGHASSTNDTSSSSSHNDNYKASQKSSESSSSSSTFVLPNNFKSTNIINNDAATYIIIPGPIRSPTQKISNHLTFLSPPPLHNPWLPLESFKPQVVHMETIHQNQTCNPLSVVQGHSQICTVLVLLYALVRTQSYLFLFSRLRSLFVPDYLCIPSTVFAPGERDFELCRYVVAIHKHFFMYHDINIYETPTFPADIVNCVFPIHQVVIKYNQLDEHEIHYTDHMKQNPPFILRLHLEKHTTKRRLIDVCTAYSKHCGSLSTIFFVVFNGHTRLVKRIVPEWNSVILHDPHGREEELTIDDMEMYVVALLKAQDLVVMPPCEKEKNKKKKSAMTN
eukprot:PhF_6_TR43570/c1_g1_i4/m.66911